MHLLLESKNYKNVSIEVILIHLSVNNDWFNFYDNYIAQMVKAGFCSPKIYANIKDKNNVVNSNSSYFDFMFSNFKNDVSNLNLKKAINKKRKHYGLPCLDYDELWYNKRLLKK